MSAERPILAQPGRANPQRALVLAVCLPITAFFVFGLTIAMDYRSDRYAMIGLALLTVVIALIPAILDQTRPADRRHILLTFYGLLFAVHFGLPVFTYYAITPMPTNPPGVAYAALLPGDIVDGQVIALIGLVSFLIGYACLPIQMTDQDIERRRSRDWSAEVILTVAVAMLIMGWAIVIFGSVGLIPDAIGSGMINTLGSSVIFGNALLTIAAIRHRSRLAWILLSIAVPISILLGFMTGSKQKTLIVPAVIVFTGMLLGGRLKARWIIIGVMVLATLYPVAQFYRQDILKDNTLTAIDALSDPNYTFGVLSDFVSSSRPGRYMSEGLTSAAARMDALGIEAVIVRDTGSTVPFQNGRTLNLFFVAFVPRLLWPSKPEITIGQWITDEYGSGSRVLSYTGPSLIGDLYLNFGVACVVVGMFVMGGLLRFAQIRLLGPHPTAVGILAAIIIIAQVHIKQMGTVAHVLSSTLFALGPVFVVYIAVRYLSRRSVAPRHPVWSEQDDAAAEV